MLFEVFQDIFFRTGRWFTLLDAIAYHDATIQSWRVLLRWLADNLLPPSVKNKALQKQVVQELADLAASEKAQEEKVDAKKHQQMLYKIKRAAGHSLALAPHLLTDNNIVNMRIMLCVGRPLWKEQGQLASTKTTAQDQLERCIELSSRSFSDVGRQFFHSIFFSARELERMGIAASQTSLTQSFDVPAAAVLERLVSLFFNVLEARFWSAALSKHTYPSHFAKMLSASAMTALAGAEEAKTMWDLLLDCESMRDESSGVATLLDCIFWSRHQLVQLTFRLLAYHNFSLSSDVQAHLHRLFFKMGDTKLIEDTNSLLKQLPASANQRNQQGSAHRVYAELSASRVFAKRRVPHCVVEQENFYSEQPSRPSKLSSLYNFGPVGIGSPECDLQDVREFVAPTPASSRVSVAAAVSLLLLKFTNSWHKASCCWQTCCFKPGSVVRCREALAGLGTTNPKLVSEKPMTWWMVIASAQYAACLWPLREMKFNLLVPEMDADWIWTSVTDLDNWEESRWEPALNKLSPGQFGFLGLLLIGPRVPLLALSLASHRLLAWQEKAFAAAARCTTEELLVSQLEGYSPPDVEYFISMRNKTVIQSPAANLSEIDLARCGAAWSEVDAENQQAFDAEAKALFNTEAVRNAGKKYLKPLKVSHPDSDDEKSQSNSEVEDEHPLLAAKPPAIFKELGLTESSSGVRLAETDWMRCPIVWVRHLLPENIPSGFDFDFNEICNCVPFAFSTIVFLFVFS